MKRHISISLRLTLWFGAVFMAGWVLFGVSMGVNLTNTLRNERRLTLARRLDRLQQLLINDQNSTPADRFQDLSDFAHATGNGLAEVLREDGSLEIPAPSSAAAAFPWPRVPPGDPNLFTRAQAADQSYWVLARPFRLGTRSLILIAAAPEAGNLLVLHSFLNGLLASVPVLLLVSSAAGYWLSRRALRPVDRIAATARSISIRNISERVPVNGNGDELQRLAETCNEMLERLESSVNQIKRFTADASHELRGPLSFTRTAAEVALRNPSTDPDSRHTLQEIVEEMAKATLLLDDMLTLARADSVPVAFPRSQVDLGVLVKEACAAARPLMGRRQLTLASCPRGVTVLGDAAALKRLLWILLDNAIKYSAEDGSIQVALDLLDSRPTVTVRDDGIGIPAADIPYIFNRFYRADPSRSMVEGNGLGLAIAKWTAEAHQAALSVHSEPDVETTFTLAFPPQLSTAVDAACSEPEAVKV